MSRTLLVLCVILIIKNCYSQNQNNFQSGPNLNSNNGQGNSFGPGAQVRRNPTRQGNKNTKLSAQQLGMFKAQNSGRTGDHPGNQQPRGNNNNGPMSTQFQNNGPSNQSPNQINLESLRLRLRKAQNMQQNSGRNSNQMNQSNGPKRSSNQMNQPNRPNQGSNQMNQPNGPNQGFNQMNQPNGPNQGFNQMNQPEGPNQVNQPNRGSTQMNQPNGPNRGFNQMNQPNGPNRGFNQMNQPNGPNQGFNQMNQPNGPNQGFNQMNQPNGPNQGFNQMNQPNGPNQGFNQLNQPDGPNQVNQPNRGSNQMNQPNGPNQGFNQMNQPNGPNRGFNQMNQPNGPNRGFNQMNQVNRPNQGSNQVNKPNGPNRGLQNGNVNGFSDPTGSQNTGSGNASMKRNFMNSSFQFRANQRKSIPNSPKSNQPQQAKLKNTMNRNAANKKKANRGNVKNMKKARSNSGKKTMTQKQTNLNSGMKSTPRKISPRKFYWKTLFPSGTASEESAEVLYSTKLVLITSENAPTIDEFNKGGILMDFRRGMMAIRMDVIPGTNFPGMPFNGQRACFLMKNITTFDQTVKELHNRGKTKRNLELGEMMHMVATEKQRLDGPSVRKRGGVFVTRYCQDAINSNNVYLLTPEAAVEMNPKTFQVSGLVHAMEPLYPIPVNIGVELTIDFGPPPTMTPAMNFNPSTSGWGRGWGNNGGWG